MGLAETQPIKSTLGVRLAREECSLHTWPSAPSQDGPPLACSFMSVWEGENVKGLITTMLKPREELLSGQAFLFSIRN